MRIISKFFILEVAYGTEFCALALNIVLGHLFHKMNLVKNLVILNGNENHGVLRNRDVTGKMALNMLAITKLMSAK